MLETLVTKYQEAKDVADGIYIEILNYSDGFMYLTKLRCYGSIQWDSHNNEFTVQELCNEYRGDNGIVDVYTNNPNNKIRSYGDVTVMSEDELKNLSKEDISMSQAMTNWMIKTIR